MGENISVLLGSNTSFGSGFNSKGISHYLEVILNKKGNPTTIK
jgi:hypothetical protein